MKNKLALIAACSCISVGLYAQRYVNAVTGASAGQVNEVVKTQWNTTNNNPTVLMGKASGFALMNFNEATGALVSGNGITLDGGTLNKYAPIAMAQVGVNQFVVGQDANNIYYTLANTNSGNVVYSRALPKTYSGPFFWWQDAAAVDVVYDGSQYCYLLTESSLDATGTSRSFGYIKINVLTGTIVVYAIEGAASPGVHKYPNDIEFVDNTHIFVSGVRDNQGTKKFFVKNIAASTPITEFAYSTSTLTPAHCYVKASGTTLWLSCDMNNSLVSTSPLVLIKITDNGSGYTFNSGSTFSYSMLNIVSVDFRSNYLLIGSTNSTNSQAQQFLFNTSTATMTSLSSYSTTGLNVKPHGIYSSASQRVFTALCDNSVNILYNLRTDVNSTATHCHSPISVLPKSILVPVTTLLAGWKAGDGILMQMTYSTVGYTLTIGSQCLPFSPNANTGGNNTITRSTSAIVAPNPSNDQLQISAAEEKEIAQVEIYTMTGQLIQSVSPENGALVQLSTASLNNGIYLFIIRNTDGTIENKNVAVQH